MRHRRSYALASHPYAMSRFSPAASEAMCAFGSSYGAFADAPAAVAPAVPAKSGPPVGLIVAALGAVGIGLGFWLYSKPAAGAAPSQPARPQPAPQPAPSPGAAPMAPRPVAAAPPPPPAPRPAPTYQAPPQPTHQAPVQTTTLAPGSGPQGPGGIGMEQVQPVDGSQFASAGGKAPPSSHGVEGVSGTTTADDGLNPFS